MIKQITTLDELEALANKSAPTWEGVSIEGLEDDLKEIDPEVEAVYVLGKDYNNAYGLIKDPYPDDLNIIFLDKWSINMMDWKFKYGCRWADDVRDNNLWHENY